MQTVPATNERGCPVQVGQDQCRPLQIQVVDGDTGSLCVGVGRWAAREQVREVVLAALQTGDRQLEIAGVKVVVDEMSLMYLVGVEIDYVEGLQGAGFKFNNPNVKSTCGCGSSFSV